MKRCKPAIRATYKFDVTVIGKIRWIWNKLANGQFSFVQAAWSIKDVIFKLCERAG